MSKIIQLKESLTGKKDNSNPIDQRGEYVVNLNPPLELQKGSQLGVRSCFLDTRSTTQGKIKIDATNKDIEFSHYLYITSRKTTPAEFEYFDLAGATNPEKVHPDGQRYILSRKGAGPNTNLGFINSFTIPRSAFDDPSGPDQYGGFYFTISYQAPDPTSHTGFVTKTVQLSAPREPAPIGRNDIKCTYQKKSAFAISMFDNGTGKGGCNIQIQMSKKDQNRNLFHKITDFIVTTTSANDKVTFEPIAIKYKFSIDEGNYSPPDLAKVITDKLVIYKTTPTGGNSAEFTFTNDTDNVVTNFVTNNPYFTSMAQVNNEDANWGLNGSDKIFFVREDGKCILKCVDNPDNYYFGCSELSLEFNEDTQKFVLNQIHQPIFNQAAGNAPVQVVNQLITTGDGRKLLIGHSGGIIFCNPPAGLHNFLADDLGFGPDLFVQPEQGQNGVTFTSPAANSEVDVTTHSFDLSQGVNVTGGVTGADSAVLKSNNFDIAPADGDIANTGILNTFDIFALNSTSEPHLSDGYFLVQIEGLPSADFIGLDTKTPNVQAIVSRFYATQDFVIMEGYAGSMPYTHQSDEPFILSSVKVRIIDADGGTIPSLGDNNTVFLEYIPPQNEM